MNKRDHRRQVNFRLDDEMEKLIDDLRGHLRPIPSISDLMREALKEKAARDLKREVRR